MTALPSLANYREQPGFRWTDPFERLAQSQTAKLDALIAAAEAARPDAAVGLLFASHGGKALVNAAFDLFECDDLYRLASDVSHDMGETEE